MKKENLLIIAAAGIGLFMLSKFAKGGTLFASAGGTAPTVNGSARTAAVNAAPSSNIFSPGYGITNGVGLTLGGEGQGFQVANVYDSMGYLGTTK